MSISFLEILSGSGDDDRELLFELHNSNTIQAIEKVLEVVYHATGMGFAAVVRVTESRWIACAVADHSGFGTVPGGELPVETTLCDSMRKTGERIVIDDVTVDPVYCDHQCPVLYKFRSYASVPIVLKDGSFFGSLCAFDPEPRPLKERGTEELFRCLAEMVANQLDSRREEKASSHLQGERKELVELMTGCLESDLLEPLSSMNAAVQLASVLTESQEANEVLGGLENSSKRLADVLMNLSDLVHVKLEGELRLRLEPVRQLENPLRDAVREQHRSWPGRQLSFEFSGEGVIECDLVRLQRITQCLVDNGFRHGQPGGAVQVRVLLSPSGLQLTVCSRGELPRQLQSQPFHPFVRGGVSKRQRGAAFSLFVSEQLARSHGGSLTVHSADGETCFALQLPAAGAS